MINSQDVKNGTCIRMDGKLYFVIEFLHVKPGKGNTIMRVKLKDVVSGAVIERRFNIGEKLEDVRVERRQYQYLYKDNEDFIFMNQETYEQIPIAKEKIVGVDFLCEGFVVDVIFDASSETVLYAELPTKVELTVAYTEPGLKGDTATNALKPATMENGATVRVPLFIDTGERIRIDTRDGSYIERAK
ncbi:MAG: elongation factor P [Paludibacteraceae bacterium]|jgi:elongation factor P|nr:elongation factor P [Paludibacteraceae bacterium]MDI9537118.1 elongation factor P [Bacteroidota bacterium]OQC34695.1 MAG: Elongation factor P [Bacteroidetes bacterium ADurb.Bin057]HHT61337.1 elongation factor P [Bacteroidales bacterium]MBP9039014.1 elongation factor P [Paludibacteraceae bacterium]